MSGKSIFASATLDRALDHWEDHLLDLTPVECPDGRWFKREDTFAPIGMGGPDGSKVRNLVWQASEYLAAGGDGGILTAGSVHSPQIGRSALVARHYGLPCTVILGGTNATASMRHSNVAIAAICGASFRFTNPGYNPVLQKALRVLRAERPTWFAVTYGVGVPDDASDAEIERFHRLGAHQVQNLPEEIETLIVPAGSCNTVASVLYGLARFDRWPARVVLVGVGPSRMTWLQARLDAIERAAGLTIKRDIEFHDLHAMKFAAYAHRMGRSLDGIAFHPTYEGKVISYLEQNSDAFASFWNGDGRTALWIVGSESDRRVVEAACLHAA